MKITNILTMTAETLLFVVGILGFGLLYKLNMPQYLFEVGMLVIFGFICMFVLKLDKTQEEIEKLVKKFVRK